MFCAGIAYARYAYLNEDEFTVHEIHSIFDHLHTFWKNNRNDKFKFPRTDMFYVMSARMLLYSGHYYWQFASDWDTAVTQVESGLKGLNKVKHGIRLIRQDFEIQIRDMRDTIKEKAEPREKKFLRNVQFSDEEDDQMKKPMAVAKKLARPQPNLFDMVSTVPVPSINFQIHDDDNEAASVVTPNVKKSSRNRLKRYDDMAVRTPSQQLKPIEIASRSKTAERPKRTTRLPNVTPTMRTDMEIKTDVKSETTGNARNAKK